MKPLAAADGEGARLDARRDYRDVIRELKKQQITATRFCRSTRRG